MNVLERLVEEELTRVPPGPSANELRHRARVRRARRFGSVAILAIVLAVLGIAAMLQSPASHHVQVVEPVPTESTARAPVSSASLANRRFLPNSELSIGSSLRRLRPQRSFRRWRKWSRSSATTSDPIIDLTRAPLFQPPVRSSRRLAAVRFRGSG